MQTPISRIWWREPNAFYSRKAKAKLIWCLKEKERQRWLRIDRWLKTPARKADWMKVFTLWICNEIRPPSYCLSENRKPQMPQELRWSSWIRIKLYSSIYSKIQGVEVCLSTPQNRTFWIQPICLILQKLLRPLDSQEVWRDEIIKERRRKLLDLLVDLFLECQHQLSSSLSSAHPEITSYQFKQNEMVGCLALSIKPKGIHITIPSMVHKLVTSQITPTPSSEALELPVILANQPKWPKAA